MLMTAEIHSYKYARTRDQVNNQLLKANKAEYKSHNIAKTRLIGGKGDGKRMKALKANMPGTW